jgi:hypothetical protein
VTSIHDRQGFAYHDDPAQAGQKTPQPAGFSDPSTARPAAQAPWPTPTTHGCRSDGAFIPDDHVIVLFGGLGDLARRKLLPGLFHLDRAGLMPAGYKIIGTSRKGGCDDDFRRVARDAIGDTDSEMCERFAERLSFSAFRVEETEPLQEAVARAERELGGEPRRLHYLSIPPGAFGDIVVALGSSGLADRWSRACTEVRIGAIGPQAARVSGVIDETDINDFLTSFRGGLDPGRRTAAVVFG